MKILLTAINAKYIHSNPAVYSLKAYAEQHGAKVSIAEFTINHQIDFILQELYKRKPDVLCFSCYIWNIKYVVSLASELVKLLPEIKIWAGGPEVSYETDKFLSENKCFDGVMVGEGEETFRELCEYYAGRGKDLSLIKGIVYWNGSKITETKGRPPLDLNTIPFYYSKLDDLKNRIIYYESSRGCPFSCSYCLSSIEKSLRFRGIDLVKKELLYFLNYAVTQVKFVDRTFNCNHKHAFEIWKFLKDHDNGVTNFHFEISADLLTEEEIQLVSHMRRGLIQFEIGVQSVNENTIKEIQRTMNLDKLMTSVKKIQQMKNIHQHLDLIAGLPMEDYESFQNSFNCIYKLKAEQLQMGFLKILKGSIMYHNKEHYGMIFRDYPPYEILETKWISYGEILKIKKVEEMLEIYYNSMQYVMTIKVLELAFQHPFDLFLSLGEFYESNQLSGLKHSRLTRSEILLDFTKSVDDSHFEIYKETLLYDLYARERPKKRPDWSPNLDGYKEIQRQIKNSKKYIHLEPFHFDFPESKAKILEAYPKKLSKEVLYLFSYAPEDKKEDYSKISRLSIQ